MNDIKNDYEKYFVQGVNVYEQIEIYSGRRPNRAYKNHKQQVLSNIKNSKYESEHIREKKILSPILESAKA